MRGIDREFEVQLGNVCNNRCVFCSCGRDTEEGNAGMIALDELLETLDEGKRQGFRKLTLLGGEPTLYKTFFPTLQRAVDLGFEEIVIFTNGVKTRNRWFIDQVVERGDFTWRISIQGGNEAAHDRVTGRKGSFGRIVTGLEYLQELGQKVTCNICVNEHSYRSLPDLPAVVAKYGIRQMCVDQVRPNGLGPATDEYLSSILAPYGDMAPYIDEMLLRFEQLAPDCEVNVTNFPYCLLPQWAHVMSHAGTNTTTFTVDQQESPGEVHNRPFDKYEFQCSEKVHVPQCQACAFRPSCRGVPGKYIEYFGSDELVPVSFEQLVEMDGGKNLFALLTQQKLEALLTTTAPEGWTVEMAPTNHRDRILSYQCHHSAGDVFLTFCPPWELHETLDRWPPMLVARSLELRVLLMPGGVDGPIDALLAWVQEIVGAIEDVEIIEQHDWSVARLMNKRLVQGRLRIARVIQILHRQSGFDGWRFAGAETTANGAVLRFRNGVAGGFSLVMTLNEERILPAVTAGFEVDDPADRKHVRTAARQIRRLLGPARSAENPVTSPAPASD
jgi:MoaA/NifB/PqqE/SkfB family radical SAM enzyme